MAKKVRQPSLFDYFENVENNENTENNKKQIQEKKSIKNVNNKNSKNINTKPKKKLSFLDEDFINKQKQKELKEVITKLQQIYMGKNFYFEEIEKSLPIDSKDKIEIIHKSFNEFNAFYKKLVKIYKKYPNKLNEFIKIKNNNFDINGFKIPFKEIDKNIDTEYIYKYLNINKEISESIFKNRNFLNDENYPMLNKTIKKYIDDIYEKLKAHNKNIEIKIENFTKKYSIKNSKITFTRTMVTSKEYAKHTLAINKNGIVQTKSSNQKHKEGSPELNQLLETIKKSKYLSEIEIDKQVDLNKLKDFIEGLDKIDMVIDFPIILKVRPLGNYGAMGLHIRIHDKNTNEKTYIIALDPKNPEAFIHELTHLIDIQKLDKNENIKQRNAIISYFEKKINTIKIPKKQREYYLNDKEIIARLGEIYWHLKRKENDNIINIENKEGIIPIINSEEYYIKNKNIYFNFDKWTKEDKELLNKFFDNYYLKKELELEFKNKLEKQEDKILKKKKNKRETQNHLPLLLLLNKDFQKIYLNNINKNQKEKYYEELPYYMFYYYNILDNQKRKQFPEAKINQIYFKINDILQNGNIKIDDNIINIKTLFIDLLKSISKTGLYEPYDEKLRAELFYRPISAGIFFKERIIEDLKKEGKTEEEINNILKPFSLLTNIYNNSKKIKIDKITIRKNKKFTRIVPIIDIKQYENKEIGYNNFFANYVLFPNKLYQYTIGYINIFSENMITYLQENELLKIEKDLKIETELNI